MAIYCLMVSTISKAKNHSAEEKVKYISRVGKYSLKEDKVRLVMSGNMPTWASSTGGMMDPATDYWRAADAYERANGRLCKQIVCALPRELTKQDQLSLARTFAEEVAATEEGRLPWTLAVHEGHGANPHFHLMVSERLNDGLDRSPEAWFRRASTNKGSPEAGGARKTTRLKSKGWLFHIRALFALLANKILERAGFEERIDHRTLEAQGIDRRPTKHIGPRVVAYEQRTGEKSYLRAYFEEEMGEGSHFERPRF